MALLFVLLVSGVKAIAEDLKRHNQDGVTNNSLTRIVNPENGKLTLQQPLSQFTCSIAGTLKETKWKDVQVGDIVKVMDDELFPADILCLKTGLPDRVCFIRTTNLDGESNLKIRKPVDLDVTRYGQESISMSIDEAPTEVNASDAVLFPTLMPSSVDAA